jgi:hypothetical protein
MRAIYMPLCIAVLGNAAACGPAKPAESPSSNEESSQSSGATPTAAKDDADSGGPSADTHATTPAPSKPAPAPAADPSPPAAGEKVPYDKEAVTVPMRIAVRQVKANCGAATDEEGKATGPWGKTTVTVTLGHNGHVRGAAVPSPYDGKPVGRCITRAFSTAIYPPFNGPDTPIEIPVEVVQPAAPPPTSPTPK